MINIQKITQTIEKRRHEVAMRLRRLKKEDPFMTEDRSLIVEPGTDAAILSGHERTVILEDKMKRDLVEIESALAKIKKGTYGKCGRCSLAIDLKRLEVKPQAVYCLKCESELENNSAKG